MTVIFECRATAELKRALEKAGGRYEVGGVLLGERSEGVFRVFTLTSPRSSDNSTGFSFVLDGREETILVRELMDKLERRPEVVGVWHSHTDGNRNFSRQDRASNIIAAKQFGGAISVLAVQEETEILLFGSYVDPSGEERSLYICTE